MGYATRAIVVGVGVVGIGVVGFGTRATAQTGYAKPGGYTGAQYTMVSESNGHTRYCEGEKITGVDAATGKKRTFPCVQIRGPNYCRAGGVGLIKDGTVNALKGRNTCVQRKTNKQGYVTCGPNHVDGWMVLDVNDDLGSDICLRQGTIIDQSCPPGTKYDSSKNQCFGATYVNPQPHRNYAGGAEPSKDLQVPGPGLGDGAKILTPFRIKGAEDYLCIFGGEFVGTKASSNKKEGFSCVVARRPELCAVNGQYAHIGKVYKLKGRDQCVDPNGRKGSVTCTSDARTGWLYLDVNNSTEDRCMVQGAIQHQVCPNGYSWDNTHRCAKKTAQYRSITKSPGGGKPQ